MYIADTSNNRIRKVTVSTGIMSTIAGAGVASYNGDGGDATSASLNVPTGVALDPSGMSALVLYTLLTLSDILTLGNVFIADQSNFRIRKVTASTGIITTIAGDGATIYTGDGIAATSSGLSKPYGVALDASGTIAMCDFISSLTFLDQAMCISLILAATVSAK